MIHDLVSKIIGELWPQTQVGDFVLEKPQHSSFGDYAVSIAFRIAKETSSTPRDIAEKIVERLNALGLSEIDKIEIAGGGYINFFLSKQYLHNQLEQIFKNKEHIAINDLGHGAKVIVEYPSTNIAKPMHFGHSRVAFIGDALSNIYSASGYQVIRWDYLGDWGTSFGKVIAAYKMWGNKADIEREPLRSLVDLYVRFSAEAKDKPELEAKAREEFHKLEEGDSENLDLWQWFKKESLKESSAIYNILGLNSFDVTIGESFYDKEMKPLVEELSSKGIAQKSDGAVIVDLEKYNLPPALLQKSDGSSLYLTRDIANLRYRLATYNPAKILLVVANQQALHFEQLFAIAKILDLTSAELIHVKFGMVLGADHKKLATREGKAIDLGDVIKEAIQRAYSIVDAKHNDLSAEQKQTIAQTVAIGALKYNDLKEYRTSDIVFDWDSILDFNGNSGPYLQYTYARLKSILSKAADLSDYDLTLITEDKELAVIKHLLNYADAVSYSCETNAPNHLALYLYELATLANHFYESIPVLKDDNLLRRNARLVLIDSASTILKSGLKLLGIDVLEKI